MDRLGVRSWQAEALLQLGTNYDFVLLNCTNTRFKRRALRHALYYVLNILSLNTAATRSVPLPGRLQVIDQLDFEAEWDGTWQRFPMHVLGRIADWEPHAAIKFGMGLLRVPKELRCKIMSYHHGDPRRFRGRPCGFYELLAGERKVGQIVQIISNHLDGGDVVAFAETRVEPYSYRATMAKSYRTSPLLLKVAVRNCISGSTLPIEGTGKNYRLPSNWTVVQFSLKLFAAKMRRLCYGLLCEKAWKVAAVPVQAGSPAALLRDITDPSNWEVFPQPRRYGFLADPFPHPDGGLLVEGLRKTDGLGEIVHLINGSARVICRGAGHFSYPATVGARGEWFLVPEVADWSVPRIYRLTDGGTEFVADLKIAGTPRLVDPTIHEHDGTLYLFGNNLGEGADVLRLWTATGLFAKFEEHSASPIHMSPEGARMAGAIMRAGSRLYRFGQDCAGDYGSGIVVFEIANLSPSEYKEDRLEAFSFTGAKGPHTLNYRDGMVYFDFYRERFTPLAGVRRLRARLGRH